VEAVHAVAAVPPANLAAEPPTTSEGNTMPLEAGLLEILACPACHSPLEEKNDNDHELVCTGQDCALAYPVRDGIPVLLVDEARRPA
jgi:uncharacterized protein